MRKELLGKSSGPLLQERHFHNRECVEVEVVSAVRLRVDDKIFFVVVTKAAEYLCAC